MAYGKCFLCGKWGEMEQHHIFGGPNRRHSEKYGLKVPLCPIECHREGKKAAHKCLETRRKLEKYGQRKFMHDQNAGVEEFRAVFGRNFL